MVGITATEVQVPHGLPDHHLAHHAQSQAAAEASPIAARLDLREQLLYGLVILGTGATLTVMATESGVSSLIETCF
jgi:hypothetical protein